MAVQEIKIKRIYEAPSDDDGMRVLVDRMWPRGVSKEAAGLDEWMREVAPSQALCKWFGHDPEKFAEFRAKYQAELTEDTVRQGLVQRLLTFADERPLTLLYGARNTECNQAVVLREWLMEQAMEGKK